MPVSALVLNRSVRTQQKAALRLERSCLLTSAYQVHYRKADEPNWQLAGTIEARAPLLTLSLPELALGEYEVRVSALGFAWNRHELAIRARIRVAASGAELALPAVSDLTAVLQGDSIILSWLWKPQLGTQEPSEFAVWITQTAGVDTFAHPELSVLADGARRQYVRIPAGPARFTGVATRYNGRAGPLEVTKLPQLAGSLLAPEGQFARSALTQLIDKSLRSR